MIFMTESKPDQTLSKEGKAIADDDTMTTAAIRQHHNTTKEDPLGDGEVVC